ncbi:MAG: hypothetical protein IJV08_06420 [Bacteroidaceae bacterium]|nr:hypothetical protein [Bacteroidaceae bacterium]
MERIKKYIGAVVLGGTMLTIPSCSDTWDEHYDAGDGTSATKSLWELISENPKLSRFKEIAENATYYRDEKHPQANYTFKDMLDGSMLITAWVPENDAFTEDEFQNWLQMTKNGEGYTVQQQLMGNSIALYRQVATAGGVDTLTMLNGKKMVFDKNKFTMQGQELDEKNIPAVNGTMHTLATPLPFRYNLYEYLKDGNNAAANSLTTFHDYIIVNDTTYFDENRSIEGTPDINGDPTYVDSAYVNTNTLFFGTHKFPKEGNDDQYVTFDEGFGANITAEDSTYIMILPTDDAWNAAYQKLEKYYNYAARYVDKDKTESGSGNNSTVFRDITNVDSLKEKNIAMDITSPLCFNLHFQPNSAGNIGRWNLDDFMSDQGKRAEYFYNTFGDTLRSDETWEKSTLFEGTPVEVSNGVGILASSWNFPEKLYKPNLYIEVGNSFYRYSSGDGNAVGRAFSNDAAGEWVNTTGRVGENNFYYFYPQSATGSPKFEFKLIGTHGENRESFSSSIFGYESRCGEVMSGKYDIGVVMVPNYYIYSTDTIVHVIGNPGDPTITAIVNNETTDKKLQSLISSEKDEAIKQKMATIQLGDTVPVWHKIQATLSYSNGAANGRDATQTSATLTYDGEKVDTLWLFKDFEFPVSYKNLRQCYPTIQITSKAGSSDRQCIFTNSFCIDRIILRSKED